MTKTVRDPDKAFENAIARHVLSAFDGAPNYAGDFEYMWTTGIRAGTVDVFKHLKTGQWASAIVTDA